MFSLLVGESLEVSELGHEVLIAHLGGGGNLLAELLVVIIGIGHPPHVDAGDLEGLAVDVDEPCLDTAGLLVLEVGEEDWLNLTVLLDDEGGGVAVLEGVDSTPTEFPGVNTIEGDWVSAPELVTDLLWSDLDANTTEPLEEFDGEGPGELGVIEKDVAVWVLWWFPVSEELAESLVGHPADDTFGEDADTIDLTVGKPLEHGGLDELDNLFEFDFLVLELFWDDAKVSTSSLSDTEGKVTSGSAHSLDKEPPWSGLGVDHEVPDNLHTEGPGGVETEGVLAGWEWKIVIDGLWAGDDGDLVAHALGDGESGGGGIVTTDGEEVLDLEGTENAPDVVEGGLVATWVGTGGLDDGTTLEVDAGNDIVGKLHGVLLDLLDITGHEVLETLLEADDLPAEADSVKASAGDNAIETWGWTTTAKDTKNWLLSRHSKK